MGKNSWIALLLALVVLVTTVPARAFGAESPSVETYSEDDYGGLAPPSEETPKEASGKAAAQPAGEDENGGLAPASPKQTPSSPTKRKQDSINAPMAIAGKIPAGVSLITASHPAYLLGSGGPFPSFYPSRQVTRAEAAQMLYRLLPPSTPVPSASYSDVPEDAFYADAVKTLAGLGVLEAQDGMLDTGRAVTRGEFTRYIASFFPLRTDGTLFPDVAEDDPNAPYILSAQSYGWAQGGGDGLFKPNEVISRAAAVVLLNRALGRTADRTYIDQHYPAFYVDVSPSSWYYYDVCEATVAHQHTVSGGVELWTSHTPRAEAPADGFYLVDGWLYCYDSAKGGLVRSDRVQNHDFDASGHFTTGNNDLDAWLRKIVLAHTDASMTREEMLRAVYLYTRDSFTYLRRPPYEFGVYDYMETDALRILETGYGNCYCYASLLWYLTRWIGYDSVIYNGTVGVRKSPHSWVEITLNGKSYIFDAELEMAYRRKKRFDVNLYKFYDAGNSWNYRRPKSGGAKG